MIKFLKQLFLSIFGGCPGCRGDGDHIVEMSFVHKNKRPKGDPPVSRDKKFN